jgi:zinc/manganese transport system substrate-binding protein
MLTRRRMLLMAGVGATLATWPARAQQRVRVVATFSILGDFVKNVGGDKIEVATLVQPNGDTHVYSPTPDDARLVAAAKIVFVNGLGFEGWMPRLVGASGTKAPLIVASQGVKSLTREDKHHPGQTAIDPHAWQSVTNVKIYVANIREGLVSVDPANRGGYEANAMAYLAALDALDKEIREEISKIPPDRRKVITTHGAFGYFAEAYGMQFVSPEGVSTDVEPSARDVASIIDQIKRQKIPAVFMENINDPRLMQRIADETGAKIGGTLYSDALSAPSGPAGTYVDLMRHNVGEFAKALIS